MKLALLAGGTGAAKLAVGLQEVLVPGELTVITNSADDEEFWGLLVCPDTDSVLYRLAGLFNETAGFGVRDETFGALGMLTQLGEPGWFQLGDRDIGVHLLRDHLRRGGARLGEAVAVIADRLGIATEIIPMTDEPVRTRLITDSGELSFQEWFVRDRCQPEVRAVHLRGIETASPPPAALAAVAAAGAVIIGPSNPVLSVDPILRVLGRHLDGHRVIAVSPVVGGRALKGPTVEILRQLGEDASATGIARRYRGVITDFVLDAEDEASATSIAGMGIRTHVLDTVMTGPASTRTLAAALVNLCGPEAAA